MFNGIKRDEPTCETEQQKLKTPLFGDQQLEAIIQSWEADEKEGKMFGRTDGKAYAMTVGGIPDREG